MHRLPGGLGCVLRGKRGFCGRTALTWAPLHTVPHSTTSSFSLSLQEKPRNTCVIGVCFFSEEPVSDFFSEECTARQTLNIRFQHSACLQARHCPAPNPPQKQGLLQGLEVGGVVQPALCQRCLRVPSKNTGLLCSGASSGTLTAVTSKALQVQKRYHREICSRALRQIFQAGG